MAASTKQTTSNKPSSAGKKQRIDSNNASSSSSSLANNEAGFASTDYHIRSILIHPIGLLLVSLLNEIPLCDKLYDVWTTLNEVKERLIFQSCTNRDEILSTAMSEWNEDREVKLAQKIKEKIDGAIEEETLDGYGTYALTVESENLIVDPENCGSKGKFDFLISEKCSDKNQSKRSVVMIIKFGMDNKEWWKSNVKFFHLSIYSVREMIQNILLINLSSSPSLLCKNLLKIPYQPKMRSIYTIPEKL